MIRFKDIHIPKPCSVEYDSLQGDETKRFCGNCKEYVYDFRGKNEAYLNQVTETQGKVCGIYYEDQIRQPSLRIKRPFYFAIATKIVSIGLFIKTFFSTHTADASTTYTPSIHFEQQDTIAVIKAEFKNKPKKHNSYTISIFINNVLYKKNVSVYDGYLYMPDTTSPDDSIKIIVYKKKASRYSNVSYSIKPKEYLFTFKESDKIVVEIDYKFHFTLIKRRNIRGKRRAAVGYY
ncbi:hypothetical protein [Cytophaga aurantiaca]|uniref:hypothetical protein n=1 Tax=Cytophaga aurantiaca TaxID=29530 RepID=UPI00035E11B4|nr:hypothetical protein [Cytophaga aurantiaca]